MNTEWQGDDLLIRVPNARKAKGAPSASGKMLLVESTHGFVRVPDSDLSLSLNIGRKAKASA